MKTEKVHLTKEKETLIPTLYGKALDNRTANPILGDKFADEVVRHIDYDFDKLGNVKGSAISLPVRAKHLDQWTREFIAANPSSTVLHLGCGLDSRVFRIDPPASVRWYDVDYPEVIELRRRLYPERHNYELIATSLIDLRWLDQIPADRPVLVVAEGVLIYLPEKDGLALLNRVAEQFPGGQLIFDVYSGLMVRMTQLLLNVRKSGASLVWGFDDPGVLEKQVPGLRLVDEVSFLTMPELVERLSQSRVQSAIYGIMGRFRFYRRMVLHLRYQF